MPSKTSTRSRLPHAYVISGLANAFEMLRVSAAINEGHLWRAIHYEPNVGAFEAQHGVEQQRDRYNARCIRSAVSERRAIRGEHGGLSDIFVPIVAGGAVLGVLVSGPFATARPSSAEVSDRWRSLTGRQAHLADPEFADYLAITLSTLVLEDRRPAMYEQFLALLARLMAGDGNVDRVLSRAVALRDRLEESRFVDRSWEAARSMLDERTEQSWQRPFRGYALSTMGLAHAPDCVAVGLVVSATPDPDPIEALIRRDAFQRATTQLLRARGNAIAARVGDHGIAIVSAHKGSAARKRDRLLELGDLVARLARRHGLELHLGLSSRPASSRLSSHYEAALVAAQTALSIGERVVHGERIGGSHSVVLGELVRELCALAEQEPLALPARFDRYLESVAVHCGYRIDPARAYLEATYEQLAATVHRSAALDARSLVELCSNTSKLAVEVPTIKELFALYRRTVAELSRAAQRPVLAHRQRSLSRAIAYIDEHYTEPMSLRAVARIAGFAPNYFSRLFKEREKLTFVRYVQTLRTERAKRLLESSDLGVHRVAELAGFATPTHFSTVFKAATGTTPLDYRKRGGGVKKRSRNI